MEDIHRIVPNLGGDSNFSYFGVYDGHGGRQIVDFLEESLENTVYQELKVEDDTSIQDRFARAFLITDMESKKSGITTSGATCVSALLHCEENKKKLYIANIGDSRAVLCIKEECSEGKSSCAFRAQRLSHDHTADDPSEQARIQAAGGFVTRGRVLGILAVARSFGDHGMKDFVTAQPYVCELDLLPHKHPFLIMACDGVWDVMSDQEAVDMVLEHCGVSNENEAESSKHDVTPSETAAEILVDEAIERGTGDNVTAIVVFF